MNKLIFNIALIAIAMATGTSAKAQVVRTITGNDKVSCTANVVPSNQTMLDGSWAINTTAAGTLVVTDKNNNVIRMIADGGITKLADNTTEAKEMINYPVSLVVDKCGNLHITDNLGLSGNKSATPVPLSREATSWGDPEGQTPSGTDDAVVAVKNNTGR